MYETEGIILLGICSNCGNHEWDKEVTGDVITCPKCGYKWHFKKKPIYFLTGCSGIGKTTTAQKLQEITEDYVVLDADMFYNIMSPQNEEENYAMVEQVFSLTKNINQADKTVVWTMAGNIDKLHHTYGARFFSDIKVLALTADAETIRQRMIEGRGITDEGWIKGSIDYNEYFRTHTKLSDTEFETLDCSNDVPEKVAENVLEWLKNNTYTY